ncbi:sugar phosphate isomerase/epimerase [Bradyrhizobium sp. AZCC 2262]|uniref:sugar phosphate isomerase/epimerase family protein n=1 Tax=Bradyrhizobium sp. AZCC 2262 TaxID=3117022 RepID=UPI002FEFB7EB
MTWLSINHYVAPPGYPLSRFLDDAAAAGARSVGVTERALSETEMPSLKRMLRERQLDITSVNSAGFFLWDDPERSREQQAINRALIEAASELSADTLVIIGGGLHDMGPQDTAADLPRARATLETELPSLIETASRYGVRLGIEPMHPVQIFNKGTVNTLAQAAALCDRLPGLGIVLDIFHSWWEPDLELALARLADRLTLVQLCGVTQPRGPNLLPKRCAMRDGVVDISGTLNLLRRAGYRGRFEFELFARDLDGKQVNQAIQMAITDFSDFCDPTARSGRE